MNILVTGSAGYVGQQVRSEFEASGYRVIGCDKADGMEIIDLPKSKYVPEIICHLAAVGDIYKVNQDPVAAYIANAIEVARIAEYAKSIGAKLIHASTWECYSNKLSHYIASKQSAELILRAYKNLNSVVFRLGTVYGENMRDSSVISRFIMKAKCGQDLEVFGQGQYRQFIHVKDVARAFRLAVESLDNWQGQKYDIVGREKIFVSVLAKYIAEKFGVKLIEGPGREEPELIDLECKNDFSFVPQEGFWQEIDRQCQKS